MSIDRKNGRVCLREGAAVCVCAWCVWGAGGGGEFVHCARRSPATTARTAAEAGETHRAAQVAFEEVLEAEKAHVVPFPAAALEVGVDRLSAWWVLFVVCQFVRVREQDDVIVVHRGPL